MRGGSLCGQRGDGEVQASADGLGDVMERYRFRDRVEDAAGSAFFQGQLEQKSRVGAVDGGPAVDSITDIRGNARLAGGIDEHGHEAVVVRPVNVIGRGPRSRRARRARLRVLR